MATTVRKLSDIMKEMAECLLRNPDDAHSSEATHVALFFANVAWNESIGLAHARDGHRHVWEEIEAENPEMWSDFKSNDINAMIDELVEYKRKRFPHDRRRILTCGMPNGGNIRVEWLPPAAPGVDSKWEMELYGLVRTTQRKKAIQFLRKTRGFSCAEAEIEVGIIAVKLGVE